MAYFNHAFCKSFLVSSVAGSAVNTKDLTSGQIGVAEGNWNPLSPTAITAAAKDKNLIYIAQGSFMPKDKVGTHGGYKESIKSKGINPRYVTKLWSSKCYTAVQPSVTINVDQTCAPCGENFYLRLDVKGSPALRFLNHNAYAIGDSSGSSALNNSLPGICCALGQEFLDPAVALAKAAGMLLEDAIIKPFIAEGSAGNVATLTVSAGGTGYPSGTTTAAVATTGGSGTGLKVDITTTLAVVTSAVINANNGGKGYKVGDIITVTGGGGDCRLAVATVAAGGVIVETTAVPFTSYTIAQILDGTYTPSADPVADGVKSAITFVGAYVETSFGDCSFDTRDFYGKEPVQLFASILDETGDPCNTCGSTTSVKGVMVQTQGETVIREILLHERYLQSPYHQGGKDSSRFNEIEGFDAIKASVDRTASYKVYYIQHSIPRLSNPTGTFDNDQYVYQFFVKCTDTAVIADMDNMFGDIAALCNSPYGNPISFDTDVDAL
tara:strand:- start:51477 stop:52961 length:1485 start_codon:yes stop_codon:yes gene_type:complete